MLVTRESGVGSGDKEDKEDKEDKGEIQFHYLKSKIRQLPITNDKWQMIIHNQ